MSDVPELTDDEATVLRYWAANIGVPDVARRGLMTLLDPPDLSAEGRAALAAYDAKKRAAVASEAMTTHFRIRPFAEWHEEDGAVLWFTLPIQEPPWCGTPNDDDWPWVWTKKEDTCWCLLPSFFIDDDATQFLGRNPA